VESTPVMVEAKFLIASNVLSNVTELVTLTLIILPDMNKPMAVIEDPILADAVLNSPIIFDVDAELPNVSVTVLIRDRFNVFGERTVMMLPLAVLKYPMKLATLGMAVMVASAALL